jgi:hypothetical protein
MLNIQESYLSWSFQSSQFYLDLQIYFGNRSVRFGNCSEIARRLNSNRQRLKINIVKKWQIFENEGKRQKSQHSRIKTLFAEIFNFKSYLSNARKFAKEILQFLEGNIAINKDENRKSSFMKVEALIQPYKIHLICSQYTTIGSPAKCVKMH